MYVPKVFTVSAIGDIVRYFLAKKISAASQTVATEQIAPKIYHGQPPIICLQCSKFHPNRFTFGGVIAERVNTFLPRRVFPWFDRSYAPLWANKYEKILAVKFLAFWKLLVKKLGAIHCWSPNLKVGDQSPPVPTVVAPMVEIRSLASEIRRRKKRRKKKPTAVKHKPFGNVWTSVWSILFPTLLGRVALSATHQGLHATPPAFISVWQYGGPTYLLWKNEQNKVSPYPNGT